MYMTAFGVNLVIGLVLWVLAFNVGRETLTGDRIVKSLQARLRAVLGDDAHIHPLLIAGIAFLLGSFFVITAFSIFGSWHGFWVDQI